jgi:hypothetical protein
VNLDPNYLLATLAVSSIGFVLFRYGRRLRRTVFTAAGIVMLIYPYFVSSVPWMLGLVPVCLLLLWLATRMGL